MFVCAGGYWNCWYRLAGGYIILSYLASHALMCSCAYSGAIMLDPMMTKCLLVKGWKKDAGWGFPRGKISANEPDVQCAIREVCVRWCSV